MKYLLLLLLVWSSYAQSPSAIAREQAPAVVVIEALDERGNTISQGSGFIVTPAGAIVSSLHVVRGASVVRVKLPNGDAYQTSDLVDVDEAKDIVILKIKGYRLPTVRLGDSDSKEAGESVVVISSPEGLTNSVSTGIVGGVRRLETHRVFQITAPISQGSSGGALFDSTGAVIGIVTYVLKSGQNINFAIPINYARGMIADHPTRTLAQLQPLERESRPAPFGENSDPLDDQLVTAAKGKRGLAPLDPMFPRPDEALALFYRLVDGLGLLTATEVAELTRTAAVVKTDDEPKSEDYTIKYLSYSHGLTMRFSKPDRLLTAVELLVTWSIDDVKNTFGDKFKRREIENRKALDFGRLESGKILVAFLDSHGNVRTLRFTRP